MDGNVDVRGEDSRADNFERGEVVGQDLLVEVSDQGVPVLAHSRGVFLLSRLGAAAFDSGLLLLLLFLALSGSACARGLSRGAVVPGPAVGSTA